MAARLSMDAVEVAALSETLDVPLYAAYGLIAAWRAVWRKCRGAAPSSARWVAHQVAWDGDPGALVAALTAVGERMPAPSGETSHKLTHTPVTQTNHETTHTVRTSCTDSAQLMRTTNTGKLHTSCADSAHDVPPFNPPLKNNKKTTTTSVVVDLRGGKAKEVARAWNAGVTEPLQPVEVTDDAARCDLVAEVVGRGPDYVERLVARVQHSEFLRGQGKDGFVADFAWVMKHHRAVMEGRYDRLYSRQAAQQPARASPKPKLRQPPERYRCAIWAAIIAQLPQRGYRDVKVGDPVCHVEGGVLWVRHVAEDRVAVRQLTEEGTVTLAVQRALPTTIQEVRSVEVSGDRMAGDEAAEADQGRRREHG